MLGIRKLTHITHAVRDRTRAEALYLDVFGARKFHEGALDPQGERCSLLALHDLCIRLVEVPDLQAAVEPMVSWRPAEGFHGLGFTVADLDEAALHLEGHGVRIVRRTPWRLLAHPHDAFGVALEFRREALPDDPRLQPGWTTEPWARHPLGLQGLWGITVLVADPAAAQRFCIEVLEARPLMVKVGPEVVRSLIFFTIGDVPVSVIEPAGPESELTRVTARLEGGQGVHGVSFLSSRVAEMPQYFRSKGIGLLASPDSRRVPHPRALMGARFIFLERPHPDDPRYRRVA